MNLKKKLEQLITDNFHKTFPGLGVAIQVNKCYEFVVDYPRLSLFIDYLVMTDDGSDIHKTLLSVFNNLLDVVEFRYHNNGGVDTYGRVYLNEEEYEHITKLAGAVEFNLDQAAKLMEHLIKGA